MHVQIAKNDFLEKTLAILILENDVHLSPIEELVIFSIKFSSFGPPARKNLHLNFELRFSNSLI